MLSFAIPATIMAAIGIFLTIISLDLKMFYQRMRESLKNDQEKLRKTIDLFSGTALLRFAERTNNKIQKSNIRMYFRYNVGIHYLIALSSSTLMFIWISQHMNLLISLVFSIFGLILPNIFLQLITDIMNYRIKKYRVDFLIIFKNFLIADGSGNIFRALEKAQDYFSEPLRTYTKIMVFERTHKISPIKCIENFIEKIQDKELILFMENLKICEIHDGDKVALIDEFTNEVTLLNDDADKEDTEDQILKLGLYLLLILNYIVVIFMLNSKYSLEITSTFYGNIAFLCDTFASFYIAYMTLEKVN